MEKINKETGEMTIVSDRELIDDIFCSFRSRTEDNLVNRIKFISGNYYPELTPNILNVLREKGLLKNIPNVNQVHFERAT